MVISIVPNVKKITNSFNEDDLVFLSLEIRTHYFYTCDIRASGLGNFQIMSAPADSS